MEKEAKKKRYNTVSFSLGGGWVDGNGLRAVPARV